MTGRLRVSKSQSLRGEARSPFRGALFDFETLRLCDFSTPPAESPAQMMWSEIADSRDQPRTAENGPILRSFLPFRLTGRNGEDCYTFERVASSPDEFRTNYYYHYKRTRVGLKEETTWS
jgi:hypothetical protein